MHRYLQEAKEGSSLLFMEITTPLPRLKTIPAIFYREKHYHQILIKEVIPQKLWEELYSHAGF